MGNIFIFTFDENGAPTGNVIKLSTVHSIAPPFRAVIKIKMYFRLQPKQNCWAKAQFRSGNFTPCPKGQGNSYFTTLPYGARFTISNSDSLPNYRLYEAYSKLFLVQIKTGSHKELPIFIPSFFIPSFLHFFILSLLHYSHHFPQMALKRNH